MQKSPFGRLPDGTEIDLYTLSNANGVCCKIITYGGAITEIQTPDREGKFANIVLGYDRLQDYLEGKDYRGAIIGRVANRIAQARFTLEGKTYALAANDAPNHLHGGARGFDKVVWQGTALDNSSLSLDYTSNDGEEGYPGTVKVNVVYTLKDEDALYFTCRAVTDRPTLINLTSHPYWNLAGSGDVLRHELTVAANDYTPMNGQHLPTGTIEAVAGTPFDFRSPTAIGSRLKHTGYNANYVLKNDLAWAVRARDPGTGRALELATDQLGLQFYSGGFLSRPFSGFCLETQNFPDAVNHANFPCCILRPGEVYRHQAVCRFFTA